MPLFPFLSILPLSNVVVSFYTFSISWLCHRKFSLQLLPGGISSITRGKWQRHWSQVPLRGGTKAAAVLQGAESGRYTSEQYVCSLCSLSLTHVLLQTGQIICTISGVSILWVTKPLSSACQATDGPPEVGGHGQGDWPTAEAMVLRPWWA